MKNHATVRSFAQSLVLAAILQWGALSAGVIVYELVLDDGSMENQIGAPGNSFIWFNQFTQTLAISPSR